jgi:hypothetical protein
LFARSIAYLGLAVLAAAVIGSPTRGDETKKSLNVLFLFSDDLRPELETYGYPIVKTPNINDLAASSVRLDQ